MEIRITKLRKVRDILIKSLNIATFDFNSSISLSVLVVFFYK